MNPRVIFLMLLVFCSWLSKAGTDTTLVLKKVIRGNLASKSVVYSGNGLFFAQNMMYKHTISVFNRAYLLVKTIPDHVDLADYGIENVKGSYKGAPVEAAFTHNGKYAWVSNYQMIGEGFSRPGCDSCIGNGYDESYLYRINTETFSIEKVIRVGSVPKYVAASPNNKYILVSNWSSGDVSVVEVENNREIKRIKAGAFPRGIAIDSRSKYAYVAMMGGTGVMKIDLDDFSTSWIKNVGAAPRHLCISSNDSVLYVSLNSEGKIARINLNNYRQEKISCAGAPRSMVLSADNRFLYVVNYTANRMSKIDLEQFRLVEQCMTHDEPIGITFDNEMKEIWVACYSGSIMVFADKDYNLASDLSWVLDGAGNIYETLEDLTGTLLASKNETVKKNLPEGKAGNKEKPVVIKKDQDEPVKVPKENVPEKTKTAEGEIIPVAGEMYVVIGSFKVESNAEKLRDKLKAKGYPVVTFRNKNGLLCAALGAYKDVITAQDALEKIRHVEKMEGWILKN